MRQNNNIRIVQWFLIFMVLLSSLVLISSAVSALGVGPSRQVITFTPGEEMEGELIIINDKSADFRAAVYAQGELSNYVELESQLLDVSAGDSVKRVKYKVKFPDESPSPGPHKLDIVVRQFPSGADVDQGSYVSANLAVMAQLIIKVPYPGKYAEVKMYIADEENPDTPITFNLVMYNFGTEDISEAHARIEIKGPLLGKIDEFNTETVSIDSKAEKLVSTSWTPAVSKGTYKAVATIYYDDKQVKVEQNFDIGAFVIDVSDISVDKFTLGDVAKFDILLSNNWNTEIEDVYVEMTVEDSKGKEVTEFKTASIDIPAQQMGKLEAYWYTEDAMPGTYTVKLLVHYEGKIVQKEYEFEVGTNDIKRVGAVGHVVTARSDDDEMSTQGLLILLIMVVIVLLLVMNFVWFYFLAKQLRKKGEDK